MSFQAPDAPAPSARPVHLHPGSRHAIPVRKPGFAFGDDIPRHWLAGNAVATHFFNGLNLVFPDGERFFIDAVRCRLSRIEDPDLRRQVRGFFGQEGRHAHEHERYFEALEAQGYEIRGFLRRFHAFTRWNMRWMPTPLRLALTAGAEHYTATLGAHALEEEFVRKAHPTMRDLIFWHATEEIEHKAVAFDVLRATHPSHALRVLGFAVATVLLAGWTLAGTHMLLKQDLAAGRLTRAELREMRRQLRDLRTRGAARLRGRIRDYLRRDFHPNDVDDLELARRSLAELGLGAEA